MYKLICIMFRSTYYVTILIVGFDCLIRLMLHIYLSVYSAPEKLCCPLVKGGFVAGVYTWLKIKTIGINAPIACKNSSPKINCYVCKFIKTHDRYICLQKTHRSTIDPLHINCQYLGSTTPWQITRYVEWDVKLYSLLTQ